VNNFYCCLLIVIADTIKFTAQRYEFYRDDLSLVPLPMESVQLVRNKLNKTYFSPSYGIFTDLISEY
jgi:hypothetical protein